jgi:hypothetical protein
MSLALALALLFLGDGPSPACACTCFGPDKLEPAVSGANAVFVGRVRTITWDRRGERAKVRLRVTRAWKWSGHTPRPPRDIVVYTTRGPACGAYFSEGEEWLVFASRDGDDPDLWTHQCSGSDAIASSKPGEERGSRELRAKVLERLRWLERHHGSGSRPGAA